MSGNTFLIATGEQVTVALLSLAIKEIGQPARSYLGHQVRIETDNAYGKVRTSSIDSTKIVQALTRAKSSSSPVSKGSTKMTTSRPWGGAARTPARWRWRAFLDQACEIYTDVEVLYHRSAGSVPQARKSAKVDI